MRAKNYLICAVISLSYPLSHVFADLPNQASERLPEVVVESQREPSSTETVRPLPEVQGAKIYSGKKTSLIELASLPEIPNNNYRQAFSQTAGLLTSEVSGEGFASISFRGLGDHHSWLRHGRRPGAARSRRAHTQAP